MSTSKRVVKNTLILYSRMLLTVVISLYSTRIILNTLGASDYGTFNVVGGAIAMLTFLNSSMAAASQRFISYALGKNELNTIRNIFNNSVIIHALVAIILVILIEGVGFYLFDGILKIPEERIHVAKLIYQFMIVSTVFNVISVPYDALVISHENMLFVAITSFVNVIGKFIIAIYLSVSSYDKLITYGFLMMFLNFGLYLLRKFYCHKKYTESRVQIKKYFHKAIFKEMTGFAGWSLLATSSSMLSNYGQGIIVNMFFGTIVNAAQGVVGQLSRVISSLTTNLLKALNPIITKSEGAGNRELMLKSAMMGSKVTFFLLMFFYIPLFIETPFIFKLWLKNVPEFTIIFCRLALIRNLIEQLFFTLVTAISAVGNIKKYKIWASVLSFFPLILAYLLFKWDYPVYTIYIIFIVYSIFDSILILYYAKVICGLSIIHFFNNNILRCFLAFAVVFVISYLSLFFIDEGFTRLIITLTVSSSFFMLIVWFVGFSFEEKSKIKSFYIQWRHGIKQKYNRRNIRR